MRNFTNITQKSKKYYNITVFSIKGFTTSDHITRSSLNKMCEKFGGLSNGSGYNLLNKERDFGFSFPTKKQAQSFVNEAVKKKLIKKKVCLSEVCLDWVYGDCELLSYNKVSKV